MAQTSAGLELETGLKKRYPLFLWRVKEDLDEFLVMATLRVVKNHAAPGLAIRPLIAKARVAQGLLTEEAVTEVGCLVAGRFYDLLFEGRHEDDMGNPER